MIGVIGAGGHAKVITDILQASFTNTKLVFFSRNPHCSHPFFQQFNHVDDHKATIRRLSEHIVQWHVAIGDLDIRKEKVHMLEQLQYELLTAIHPATTLAPSCQIGDGSAVMAGCIVNSDTVIGQGCIINTGSIIDHDCRIDPFVNIGPGCRLAGGVTIGEGTELGTGAIVIPNVTIGKNCIIGAGSVVIRHIPDGSRAVGVPAQRID